MPSAQFLFISLRPYQAGLTYIVPDGHSQDHRLAGGVAHLREAAELVESLAVAKELLGSLC